MTAVPISSAADLATLRRRTSDGAMPAVLGCGQLRELGRGKQVTAPNAVGSDPAVVQLQIVHPARADRPVRAMPRPHELHQLAHRPGGRAALPNGQVYEPLGRHRERIAPVQRAMLAACGQLVTTLMTYASSAGSVATSLARAPA